MNNQVNKVLVQGNLVKDPEKKDLQNGGSVVNFTIANNEKFKDFEHTNFVDCECFGPLADIISNYAKKGRLLMVDGQLRQHRWETKEGEKRSMYRVRVNDIQFMDKPSGNKEENNKSVEKNDSPF